MNREPGQTFGLATTTQPTARAVAARKTTARMSGGIVSVALALLAIAGVSATDQWPQFRGPHTGAIPDDPTLPDTWSETENIVWKAPVPGLGWSSPVVWDDHIFLTSAISSGEE